MFFLLNLTVPMFLLLSSLTFIFSSSSWFIAWMGLELNMMAFMPMIISTNKLSSEAALKYFFAQVVGSALIFLSTLLSFFYCSYLFYNTFSSPFIWLISCALMLKLGAAPFHFWFPSMIEGLTWNSTMLLMTFQKTGPLSLILLISKLIPFIIIVFMVISTLVGAISGFNQLMTRKLMSFSSIAHVGWLLCSSLMTKLLTIFYFVLYASMTWVVIFIFKFYNTLHLNQMNFYQNMMIILTFIFYMNLLSLGGLPPFLGFLPKWLVVQASAKDLVFPLMMMVFSSVVTLYFYLRLTYASMMMIISRPVLKMFSPTMTLVIKFCVTFPLMLLPLLILFM